MYRLHGFYTQNTMKTLYVLEELGIDFEYCFVDLMKGESDRSLPRHDAGRQGPGTGA